MSTPLDQQNLYVGIDAGSVSLNAVVLNAAKQILYDYPYTRHFGQVEQSLFTIIEDIYRRFDGQPIASVSFTGNHGKKLSEHLGAHYEFETISQVLGAVHLHPEVKTIIGMGGQETALFQISHDKQGWDLKHFTTNGPCASGTGSFIDQQAERLATSLYAKENKSEQTSIDQILSDFIQLGMTSTAPAHVACRCTVFTKSDMIHLQNKGESLQDIILGLHLGNARNYMSTIVGNQVVEEPILFVGGLSLNKLQVKVFKDYFPELIIPPHSTSVGALGVALQALESKIEREPIPLSAVRSLGHKESVEVPSSPRLQIEKTIFSENNEVRKRDTRRHIIAYLGIDIGSTTSKCALINENREILYKKYIPTRGKPVEVTQCLLRSLRHGLGDTIEIAGVATTGSGRKVVGDFLNVDLAIDEITAHARGAVEVDAEVDTIFEIGGQDSKYISLHNTHPLDFDMNKVCAAGTGSFIHELANKFGVNIVGEFQDIALEASAPVRLAQRCTVFMESDLVSYHQQGVPVDNLIAGLCYAIVHNYLNRVVGKRRIGKKVMFLGGPSLNKGVVAAFEKILDRPILVPRHREVLGAFGAALHVQQMMRLNKHPKSSFRGIDCAVADRMDCREKVCTSDPHCHNQCKLKIYDFGGRRSIWGGDCGRYEASSLQSEKKEDYFALRDQIWQRHMAGVYRQLEGEGMLSVDGRPTVGMQRSLYAFQTGVLWAHFFDYLGFRLVLTPPTDADIAQQGVETTLSESCYPIKVAHGHVKTLVDKTRFVFLPSMINMSTPHSSEGGFFCPMVQGSAYMIRMAHGLDAATLLTPTIHLKHDPEILAAELSEQIKEKLNVRSAQIKKAVRFGLERQNQFAAEMQEHGRKILEKPSCDQPLVIVTGRPYNLYDQRLNLKIGTNLAKIGVSAVPMDFVDVSAVDLSDFPAMFWGLGAQILRTAKYISQNDYCFGIHLTNFGCGADSFIEHFYKHIMGEKPYLILELDEHTAVAGVITRLEAYKNVIEHTLSEGSTVVQESLKAV